MSRPEYGFKLLTYKNRDFFGSVIDDHIDFDVIELMSFS